VFWIATHSNDKGAARFIGDNALNPSWFSIARRADAAAMGVRYTPTGYLVDRNRRLVGYLPTTPAATDSLPAACTEGSA
jgi:hypothetical protein